MTDAHKEQRSISDSVREIARSGNFSLPEIARMIGTSYASVVKLAQDGSSSNPEMRAKLEALLASLNGGVRPDVGRISDSQTFASRGARRTSNLPLFQNPNVVLSDEPFEPLAKRLKKSSFWGEGEDRLKQIFRSRDIPAPTLISAFAEGISAGKNTYTYDAHTYHTKVPPQGIAEIIKQYLPSGGVVLDPFAGSGMTGVAARVSGCDVILNELSPAASFIADRFTETLDAEDFTSAVRAVVDACSTIRKKLYSTECRDCKKQVELQYMVWSYRVVCPCCSEEFLLWDHCRRYGRTVREHKILNEFQCPSCKTMIRKSRLTRTYAVPVLVGYRCCKKGQVEHPPNAADLELVKSIEAATPLATGFYPTDELPDGINLRQPKKHGLTSIDKFYTPRNLAAMSHIWRAIHRINDAQVAGYLGFVFTSLYQRVARLSEYRFWGGSGNTANFNVPYIFNEANVFVTFERKARSIQDHLETTARHYSGLSVTRTGSATDLSFIQDESVDMIFTDPPFGANINYSEMNFLWESWLGEFTDSANEAIVNRVQNKDAARYGDLMELSFKECRRVLRDGHWMLVVFMNSSQQIWEQLRRAIDGAGFKVERIDIFDKQHGTFKQFVSDNTAGSDLVLHCRKSTSARLNAIPAFNENGNTREAINTFLEARKGGLPYVPFLHVKRSDEVDFRLLYSEWLAAGFTQGSLIDFASFRTLVETHLDSGRPGYGARK